MCLLCPRERKDTYTDNFKPYPETGLRACKPTEGQGWAHLICSLFMPELTYTDASRLRFVEGISCLPPTRWTRVSYLNLSLSRFSSCYSAADSVDPQMVPLYAVWIVLVNTTSLVHGAKSIGWALNFHL
jgi:hypothetical protein